MLFNSIPFAIFFTLFFLLYWFVFNRNLKAQNTLILIGNYVFYAWWDYRFLLLIIFSTGFAYVLGDQIYKASGTKTKKKILNLGLVVYVGLLLLFKYTNFFILSIDSVFKTIHVHAHFDMLNIILPLGISFYTFRVLSYLFDIKNGKFKPVSDWVVFFSFVSFFPSLVSGPIDRPKTLVPQLERPRSFNYDEAADAMRRILWGLFKKAVVADNCATIVDYIFDNSNLHGPILIAGAFFYTIQIYADFSGYSDMAIGIARLLGFNTTRNFNYPYFSQNIAEFWRKWHISLTSWLTEYIFTPLSINFRDYDTWGSVLAIIITFLISGLWHGAHWTFIVWGFLHGCYFIPLILRGKMNKKKEIAASKALPSFKEFLNMLGTFLIVMFTVILFRSGDLHLAFHYYFNIFKVAPLTPVTIFPAWIWVITVILVFYMIALEWAGRTKQHALENLAWPVFARWFFYFFTFFLIALFSGHRQQFIYFKF